MNDLTYTLSAQLGKLTFHTRHLAELLEKTLTSDSDAWDNKFKEIAIRHALDDLKEIEND